MRHRRRLAAICFSLAFSLPGSCCRLVAAPPEPADHFERKIRPLLLAKCLSCHGPEKPKAGLRLDTSAGLTKGGKSGPVVVAGKPDESLLIQAVRRQGDLKMPPDDRLSDQEVLELVSWIKAGAVWPKEPPGATPSSLSQSKATFTPEQKAFWSFRPVRPVTPPQVRNDAWIQSPVDRFILARLEAAGLSPSPPTDKRTLIRRVTLDLTGLPPTPGEIDAFVNDQRPDAYVTLVDRLLASPHYGERWARHWLDVARYAETTANDANAVMRYAWRYRDYVIRALNADTPYDQFVIEQLAGDLLPSTGDLNRDADRVIATGFLMIGPKALAEADIEGSRMDIVDDQIDTTGRAFLGLTIACARCHDHKFDPIPAVDYYSLTGIFRGVEVFRDEHKNAVMWQEWPLARPAGEPPVVVMSPKEGKPWELHVALRGNRQTPGALAPRRFLQIVAGEGCTPITTVQSGRLELARWIASPSNPLTARVMVNRVWQHHFGTGLVATSDNFGVRGEKPTHAELLDYLANEFVAGGWSLKKLHRLIVLSRVYQTSSQANDPVLKADVNNRLLARTTRRRLDAGHPRTAAGSPATSRSQDNRTQLQHGRCDGRRTDSRPLVVAAGIASRHVFPRSVDERRSVAGAIAGPKDYDRGSVHTPSGGAYRENCQLTHERDSARQDRARSRCVRSRAVRGVRRGARMGG
ncbi:MAG TPA: PSD1 and planctomycete cytochrome C domain-containing protein [Gemmataceae bacterium]|jgi:mono/diheme cytochrome c family protein|nr:PSD1 and planctomycete cytochrome C domain-containing protein [Gemmataceae bacterium]